MNLPKSARSDALLFLGGWILLICLINPIGNYPINDDWAYAQIVKRLLESGVYDLGFWPGMTLFTHVMWGSLFCKIFGFSFTILRLSTLVMAMVGSWVFFQLVRELLGEDIWSRRIALGTLVFNPFFLLLSFSYMTDVPFLTLVLLALLFFKKAFEQDRYLHWILALACCVAAILTRQLALLLPLTFGGVMVLKYRDIKHLLLAVAIVLISFLSLYGYTSYMEATVGLPPPFGRPESLFKKLNINFIWSQIRHRGGIHLFYWSIFLIPFALTQDLFFKKRKIDLTILLGAMLVCGWLYYLSLGMIPIGNLFYVTGFGPVTLQDVEKGYSIVEHISGSSWRFIQLFTWPVAVIIVYIGGKKIWSVIESRGQLTDTQLWKLAIFLMLIGYSTFMLIDIHKFDRYYFPVYPLLMLLMASSTRQEKVKLIQKILSISFLVLMAIYAIIATRDYHAWQKARWQVLEELVIDQRISPARIDGGFEFNGWYETGPSNPSGRDRKSWWFVDGDEYTIARNPFECYEVVKRFPTNTWLDPLGDSLAVLKKRPLDRLDTLFTSLEVQSSDSIDNYLSEDSLFTFALGGELDSNIAYSGRYSVLLTPERPYGVAIDLDAVQPCEQITVTAWRRGHQGSAGTVIRAPDVNVLHDFERYFVGDEQDGGWMHLRHELTVPSYYEQDILHVYLWNPVPDSIWVDDVRIIRRRTPLND